MVKETIPAGALSEFLVKAAHDGLLFWEDERKAGTAFGIPPRAVETEALSAGLRLERYARNGRGIDQAGQVRLHRAAVLVAGCGGLGGHIVEELARLGVGRLVIVDPDVFDATNLNRQILASMETLGRAKVEVAAERIASINPATLVEIHRLRLGAANAEPLLRKVDLAADALDSVPARLELEAACAERGIPLVHGAIAGRFVQATTSLPGSATLRKLYGEGGPAKGIETELGNPAFTPAAAASIQVAEIVSIITTGRPALAGVLFHLDLDRMSAVSLPLD